MMKRTVVRKGAYYEEVLLEKADGSKELWKVLTSAFPEALFVQRFDNEAEVGQKIKFKGIRRVLQKGIFEGRQALQLSFFGGVPLKHLLEKQTLRLSEFYSLAIQLSDSLNQLHHLGFVHHQISDQNIDYHPTNRAFELVNLELAQKKGNPPKELLAAIDLHYLAPEQSGRIDWPCDARTDLYALGILFYRILCNQYPFSSTDPTELVHQHLAQLPKPPIEISKGVPIALSQIVAKLLAKNPGDRYQSALGLKTDLELSKQQWLNQNQENNFELGQFDANPAFEIPNRLYGRALETQQLVEAFEWIKNGEKILLTVSGEAGVGKSALIRQLLPLAQQENAFYAEGKFDQFLNTRPYTAIIQAIRSLIDQLLTKDKQELAFWKEALLDACKGNGKLLTDAAPKLELIIGPQPELPDVGPDEAQTRFRYTFLNFIKLFASKAASLILFIDDWQWSDVASVELMNLFATDPGLKHFLGIAAYRNNEISSSHPFLQYTKKLELSGVGIQRITLKNLDTTDIAQFFKDCFRSQKADFSELVFKKTGGNIFFVRQLVTAIYQKKLIQFNPNDNRWDWDLEHIKRLNITDNIVDLMINNILELPKKTQEVLKVGAFIGTSFSKNMLGKVIELETAQLETALLNATETQCLSTQGSHYQFTHDRIQQAAYSLVDPARIPFLHRQIGRRLYEGLSKEEVEVYLFDLVNQWNKGIEEIKEERERILLARLNLKAGLKVKETAAHRSSKSYLETAKQLFGKGIWKDFYKESLQLFTALMEVNYLLWDKVEAQNVFHEIVKNGKTPLDKAKAYQLMIITVFNLDRLSDEAVRLAYEILLELRLKLPQKPTLLDALRALLSTKWMLRKKDLKELKRLPEMKDQWALSCLGILEAVIAPCYLSNPLLAPSLSFYMIKLTLKYGFAPQSITGFGTFGIFLAGILRQPKAAFRVSTMSKNLSDEAANLARRYFYHYAFVAHWNQDSKASLGPLNLASEVGLTSGDIETSAYSYLFSDGFVVLLGQPLASTQRMLKERRKMYLHLQYQGGDNMLEVTDGSIEILIQEAIPNPGQIDTLQTEAQVAEFIRKIERLNLSHLRLHQLFLSFLLGFQKEAMFYLGETKKYEKNIRGSFYETVLPFYQGLVLIRQFDLDKSRKQYLRQAKKCYRFLKRFSKYAPENFAQRAALLAAEISRVTNRFQKAEQYYRQAISFARTHAYLNEEALAKELCGRFYVRQSQLELGKHYLERAYECYRLWGAKAKTKQLQLEFPEILTPMPLDAVLGSSSIDVNTIVKASQTLAGEIKWTKLIEKMMRLLIENAGAQRGVFLVPAEGNWIIKAEATSQGTVRLFNNMPLEKMDNLPHDILNYVAITQKEVVEGEVGKSMQFGWSDYSRQQQVKSVSCLPIIHKGSVQAIIYLENNLITSAFTPRHLEVLRLLSAQIAISLENAELYEQLEEKVEARTQALNQKNEELQSALQRLTSTQTQLVQSEKMASLGQLTAGIAHEINNPINFISSNVQAIKMDFMELKELLEKVAQLSPNGNDTLELESLKKLESQIDTKFLIAEIEALIGGIERGADRTQNIVSSLSTFSRKTTENFAEADIHEGLNSTLTILNSRINEKEIMVEKKYGSLPLIKCQISKINQVFLNIINNAIHAVPKYGEIKIVTRSQGNHILISIQDNGKGMDKVTQEKIFEPFFTTKEVGEGTGLGLSISYGIIEQHQGKIEVESEIGKGTRFLISLPIVME